MAVESVPGQDIRYHLLAFDAEGRERPERDGPHSTEVLREAAQQAPTDVFLFSHGWMGDVPAARQQYGRWLTAMASCAADRAAAQAMPGGFRPLLVGLHWPSKAWGDEELGTASFAIGEGAAATDTAVGEGAAATDVAAEDDVAEFVDRYAARLSDSPATREALWTVVEAARQDAAPFTLPEDVRRAYQILDAEASLGAAGEGAAPGDDRDGFDPESMYQACQLEELASFSGPVLGGILAPLRVLTFWHMKRRARLFGEGAAAALLSGLQRAAPAARFHLMGHSFGCIVVSAAVAGGPGGPARRPVHSLMLVQGAMSLWSFCASIPARPDRTGYFRPVLASGLVDGPVLVTTSVHDRAVGTFYPLGAGARGQVDFRPGDLPAYGGIGTFGVRGPGIDIVDRQLGPVEEVYDLSTRTVYNLRGDDVIAQGRGIMGAHSDIAQPPVAHALWQALLASGQ